MTKKYSLYEKYTLQDIHLLILESKSQANVLKKLNIGHRPLKQFIGSFGDGNLTFTRLQNISTQDAPTILGDIYYKKSIPKRISDYTLSMVHECSKASDTDNIAAIKLGVGVKPLRSRLAALKLDFDTLKNSTPESIELLVGEKYHQFINTLFIDFSKYTLAMLHRYALDYESESQAATRMGTSPGSLKNHLAKISFLNAPLTFKNLQKLTINEAKFLWPEKYNQPIDTAKHESTPHKLEWALYQSTVEARQESHSLRLLTTSSVKDASLLDFNVYSKELMYSNLQSTYCAVNKCASQAQLACNVTKITGKRKREELKMFKGSNQLNIEAPQATPPFSKPVEVPYFFAPQRFFNKESDLMSTSCSSMSSSDSSTFASSQSTEENQYDVYHSMQL